MKKSNIIIILILSRMNLSLKNHLIFLNNPKIFLSHTNFQVSSNPNFMSDKNEKYLFGFLQLK